MTNIIKFPERPIRFSEEFDVFLQKVRFSEEFAVFLQKVIPEITQDEIDFYEYAIEVLWELKDLQSAPDVAYSVIMQYAIKALQFAKSLPNEAPFEE